ncbi:hypothetical protein BJY01DRAFT_251635 [Aspergillus pseudoustus]|uniref:Fungal N-terminal domain-containing protein n=1 Tax=Aspergillus pseudoustus TaxID=1810923 RepID=A0ABR4JC34_9EURO
MADPFSITGSAVGVISLGLTVCQGLLAYYGPFKSFHEEINEATSRIQSLSSLLTTLQDVISNSPTFHAHPPTEPIQAAIQSIGSCNHGLQKLEKMLDKCRTSSQTGKQSRTTNPLNRLLYPFRRETLVKLMDTVTWLQDNVNTSLLLLQIVMSNSGTTRMDSLVASSSSTASNTGETMVIAQRLEKKHSNMEDAVIIMQQRLDQMELHIRTGMERRMLSPDSLRQLMHEQAENDNYVNTLTGNGWPRRQGQKGRTADQAKNVLSLMFRHAVCNRFLKYAVTASLTVTNGSGGCSISPNLQFRAIVPDNSPAFSLLEETNLRLEKSESNGTLIKETRAALFELFYTSKASLSDTRGNGDTILHAVASWGEKHHCWEPRQWLEWRGLIQDLLNAGLTPSCVNDLGQTPADTLVASYLWSKEDGDLDQLSQAINVCADLLSGGSFIRLDKIQKLYSLNYIMSTPVMNRLLGVGRPAVGQAGFAYRFIWTLSDKHGLQDLENQAEELAPLISRSVFQLRLLIAKRANFQEVLYCYIEWPAGLELLLEAGYIPDFWTLSNACRGGHGESVRLIIYSRSFSLWDQALEAASAANDARISKIIVEAVVNRRRKLEALVQANLSADMIDSLGLRPGTLLDRQAFSACERLLAESVDISGVKEPDQYYSVYDTVNLTIQTAEQLWDAGFRAVDEADEGGYTSLMKLDRVIRNMQDPDCVLKKAVWFIGRGADLYRKALRSNYPAIFFVSHAVGRFICSKSPPYDEACTGLLHMLLAGEPRDECRCPCFVNGCSSLKMLLDGIFFQNHLCSMIALELSEEDGYSRLWKLLESTHDTETDQPSLDPAAILRYVTFIELDLTHTCHRHFWDYETPLDRGSMCEIAEEEHDIILDLEDLVDEFVKGYATSTHQLREYIEEVMWPRLDGFRKGEMTDNELDELQKIGVVVHEPEDQNGVV